MKSACTRKAFTLAALLLVLGLQADVLSIQERLEAGDLDAATKLLREAMASNPRDGGLFNLRGIVHARRDEMAEARKDFGTATRLAPALTPAWQNLARACQRTNEVTCAIDAWEHVMRAKPGDGEAQGSLALLRAVNLNSAGRVAEAKTAAERLAKEPGFTETDLDRFGEVLASPKAAAVLAALIEGLNARGDASLAGLRRLVLAYEQLKRPTDALHTLERIAQREPNNVADLLEMARLSESEKRYQEALGYLAHARDVEPNNARIHFLFGLIAGELDLALEAKGSLERAVQLEPQNAAYSYALGTAILKTRDAASAATYLQLFVEAKPADANGHYALGLAYFASGDYEKAKEQMQVAAQDAKMAGAADYYLGRIARIDGDLPEASRLLRRSVERLPKFSESHTELARIALAQKDMERARAELSQALRLTPESFQANEQLLILYRRTHDARAEQQAEALKKLDEERSKRAELMLRSIEVRP